MSTTVTIHEVRFERNTVTGEWRARCSCGFEVRGAREAVQNFAAVHDLNDAEVA